MMGFGGPSVQPQEQALQGEMSGISTQQQGMFTQENNLVSLQSQANTFGAEQQQNAADVQAQSLFDQANYAISYSAEQAALQQRQVDQTAASQSESYLSAGVELEGSPLAVVNETKNLGAIQVSAINQQGSLQADLLRTQAAYTEQAGLDDVLNAQSENMINTQQNLTQQSSQQIQQSMNQLQLNQSFMQLNVQQQQAKQQQESSLLGLGTNLLTSGIGMWSKNP